MFGYVYLTTNTVNNKKYVGKHVGQFDPRYKGSSYELYLDIHKLGPSKFDVQVLDWYDSFESLNEGEYYWIQKLDAVNSPDFYNKHRGCTGGLVSSNNGFYQGTFDKETLDHLSEVRKNHRWVNNSIDELKISIDELPEYLSNGWVQGRLPGSCFIDCSNSGKIWIHNESESHLITEDKLDEYLNNGYVLGRPEIDLTPMHDKQRQVIAAKITGLKWMTNGTEDIRVKPELVNEYLAKGYRQGYSYDPSKRDENGNKVKRKSRRQWMTNGIETILVDKENVSEYVLKGYKRLMNRWVTNGVETHYVEEEILNTYLNQGYKIGRTYREP